MPISQTEVYFKNPQCFFLEEFTLFLSAIKLNLEEKAFPSVKTKTNSNFALNPAEMLKEAIIHFCLFDQSHFSNICIL